MGEIRVKVKLMNLNDETQFRHGALKKEEIRSYEADAMVDTGAVSSVIPVHVLQQLGVGTRGTRVESIPTGGKKPLTFPKAFCLTFLAGIRSRKR